MAPNATYAPQINDAAAQLRPAYDQSQGIFAKYQPGFDNARGYSEDVLSGKYLKEGNPWLQDMINNTNTDITDAVNGNVSLAGRYGSNAHTATLARELAKNESGMRFGAYNTERGYQNQAPGQISQLATVNAGLPQALSGNYADSIASLLGKYIQGNSQGTSKTSGGFLGDLILAATANLAKAGGGGG